MEGVSGKVTVFEQCRVTPAPGSIPVKSLPLHFFDSLWLTFHSIGRVILYDFPHPTDHFIHHTVPNLKTSLSLTLKHFTPLAGNFIVPTHTHSTTNIHIRYLDGDSVSLTFAECTGDLDHLTGNHVRDANIVKPLVPQLPTATWENYTASPVLAIQVTIFPNRAICIGITNSHVVADGRTMFNFVRAWASVAQQLNDVVSTGNFEIPYYDRSSIKDPYGLGTMLEKALGPLIKLIHQQNELVNQDSCNNKVRATFVLNGSVIQALKKMVSAKLPNLTYVSSFTVMGAYLWTCFAKSRATVGKEEHNLDEPQNFGFVMDCRARLDPPLPASYFGNCLVPCLGVLTGRVMIGDEGLAAAAEVLGNAISVKLKEGPLHGSNKWMEEFAGVMRGEWHIGIAGSPKFDYYNSIEFGWGKPLKFEFVDEPLSLSRCKDSKMDIEVGVVLPKNEMDVFSTVFTQGLQSLNA